MQALGMVVQVVSHEGLYKVVAMVIAVMPAQAQGLAHLLAGSLQLVREQLCVQKGIGKTLI